MMTAMAYVMMTEGLIDQAFVPDALRRVRRERRCRPGPEAAESYTDYLLGTRDGVAKTPEWAEPITGVPRATIARIAREYATRKPGVLYQGYGMQRRAYGEQVVRAGCVLAAITGNVGVPGGWASGIGLQAPDGGPLLERLPDRREPRQGHHPELPLDRGRLRGKEMGAGDGVLGADRLDTTSSSSGPSPPTASSTSTPTSTGRRRSSPTRRKVEFLVVQDNFLTPTARFADLAASGLHAVRDLGRGGRLEVRRRGAPDAEGGRAAGRGEERLRICAEIAERLGVGDAYTEGRDERELGGLGARPLPADALPRPADARRARGVERRRLLGPGDAGRPWPSPISGRDPAKHPLQTPSGKIEIFSSGLQRPRTSPTEIPAVPSTSRNGRARSARRRSTYPLQAIGHHSLARVHSTHDNVDWLEEAFPQRVFINPIERRARGLRTATRSASSTTAAQRVLPCRVTRRIMPGVVAIPQGAWWTPGRGRRRPARLGQRPDLRALDAARFRQRAAHDHGPGAED